MACTVSQYQCWDCSQQVQIDCYGTLCTCIAWITIPRIPSVLDQVGGESLAAHYVLKNDSSRTELMVLAHNPIIPFGAPKHSRPALAKLHIIQKIKFEM